MFLICMQLGILDENKTYLMDDVNDSELYYSVGKTNVSINVRDGLTYTGFDYKVEDGIAGHYYYLIQQDDMYLFILDEETSLLADKGKSFNILATLTEDSAAAKYIETELSEQMDLGADSLDGFVKEISISQPDYPVLRIKLIGYIKKLSIYLMAATLIYFVLAAAIPELNLSFKKKKLAPTRRELIRTLDKELAENLVESQRSVYLTENYKIHAYMSYISIKKR